MAGIAKPNVQRLGKEAKYKVIDLKAGCGTIENCGLFDGVTDGNYNTSNSFVWDDIINNHLEIEVFSESNVWRCGSNGSGNYTLNALLKILKWDGSTYVDITSSLVQTTTQIDNTKWEKTISNLPKGRYKFKTSTSTRVDSEWYIESLNKTKYLVQDKSNIYSINPFKVICNEKPTKQMFLDYGADDSEFNLINDNLSKISNDAQILVWTDNLSKAFEINKDVTLTKPFVQTLSNPKILVYTENEGYEPKLITSGNKKTPYKYNVSLEDPKTDYKNLVNVSYNIDENITVAKDTFKQAINPYKLNIDVEQEDGSKVSVQSKITLYDTQPFLLIDAEGMAIKVTIGDNENNKIKYQIKLNDNKIFPETADFTELVPQPVNFTKIFKSKDIKFGSSNVVEVIAIDEYGKQSVMKANIVGSYSGLMFTDENNEYYSTDLGEILKRINFGTIFVGKSSDIKAVYLKNMLGYAIKDVKINVDVNTIPQLSDVLIDINKNKFIGYHDMILPNMDNGQKIPFYIQVKTSIEQESGGIFDIYATSTSV